MCDSDMIASQAAMISSDGVHAWTFNPDLGASIGQADRTSSTPSERWQMSAGQRLNESPLVYTSIA